MQSGMAPSPPSTKLSRMVIEPAPEIEFVSVLRIEPGDVLAVRMLRRVSVEGAENIRALVRETFPGHEVLILPPEVELVVVRDAAE